MKVPTRVPKISKTALVMQSLRAEVEQNRTTLEPYIPMHAKWLDTLGKADAAPEGQGRCGDRVDNTFWAILIGGHV